MKNRQFSFPKSERLHSKIKINRLFTEGKSFIVYPLKIFYNFEPSEEFNVCILISVPKKQFKKAVRRNRIKRLIRETYRLNKGIIFEKFSQRKFQIQLAFVYVANEEMDFHKLNEKIKIALQKLIELVDYGKENH
ncbi:MAG TPA: ribonuclease P protein component [Paludibacteraceae bacterium]|nr:ribonuclease P protein component [Paludibacteraceae bacterium]